MRVHVDIDGVLLDSAGSWLVEKRGMDPSRPDLLDHLTDYDLDKCAGPGSMKEYMDFIDRSPAIRECPGAMQALHRLIDGGHDVLVTTSRPPAQVQRFKEQFPGLAGIVMEKKDVVALGMPCDVLVDDYPHPGHVKLATRVVIVRQPWNRDIHFQFAHDEIDLFSKLDLSRYSWNRGDR